MEREQALRELDKRVKNKNVINHSIYVEAIMRKLANLFGDDEESWALAGLLHDIDYEVTFENPDKHSIIGAEILEDLGLDSMICYAVKAHNGFHGIERRRKIDRALYSANAVARLIQEVEFVLFDKKLKDIDVDFLLKKFNEKSFATEVNREHIKKCNEIPLGFTEFMQLSLDGIKEIVDK